MINEFVNENFMEFCTIKEQVENFYHFTLMREQKTLNN